MALLALVAWLYTPDLRRSDLEARYARGPADFIEGSGMRLHVRDTGPRDAPAVVLLHGLGASLHTWEDWANALPELRVIRFDLPGFGLTGADPSGDYSDKRSVAVCSRYSMRYKCSARAWSGIRWAERLR